jgi:hypothetical protein
VTGIVSQTAPELPWLYDRNPLELPEREKVLVHGNEESSSAGNGSPENWKIRRVATRRCWHLRRFNYQTLSPNAGDQSSRLPWRKSELFAQLSIDFGNDELRKNESVIPGDLIEKFGTDPGACDCRDENRGIDDDSHVYSPRRWKTSSSVKIPWRSRWGLNCSRSFRQAWTLRSRSSASRTTSLLEMPRALLSASSCRSSTSGIRSVNDAM